MSAGVNLKYRCGESHSQISGIFRFCLVLYPIFQVKLGNTFRTAHIHKQIRLIKV